MSNIPQETDDIEVPPFPYSEEEEKVVETHASDPVKKNLKIAEIVLGLYVTSKWFNSPCESQASSD